MCPSLKVSVNCARQCHAPSRASAARNHLPHIADSIADAEHARALRMRCTCHVSRIRLLCQGATYRQQGRGAEGLLLNFELVCSLSRVENLPKGTVRQGWAHSPHTATPTRAADGARRRHNTLMRL